MNEKKLFEIIARVFDIPLNQVTNQSNSETIEQWDSFTGYILLDEIESEFNIIVGMNDALEIKNVEDFKRILIKKGIQFE